MNTLNLSGRLVRDPQISFSQEGNQISRFTLAVNRPVGKDKEPAADFIPCVTFGKLAEFAGNNLFQGSKIIVSGRISSGSYINKDNIKVYTLSVIATNIEFAESKADADARRNGNVNEHVEHVIEEAEHAAIEMDAATQKAVEAGFIPLGDEGLPFK